MTFNKPLQPVYLSTEKPLVPLDSKKKPEPIPSCQCAEPEYLNQPGVPEIYCQKCGLILSE